MTQSLGSVTHLPLPQRRTIATRLAVHTAFATNSVDVDNEVGARDLLELTQTLADRELHRGPAALDKSLQKIAKKIGVLVDDQPEYNSGSCLYNVLQSLRTELEAVSCSECVASRHIPPCNGTHHDNLVATQGLCLKEFTKLFSLSQDVARWYYEKYSPLYRQSPRMRIEFATSHMGEKPHDIPVEAYIGGKTEFGHDETDVISRVRLIFVPNKFDWNTNLAIPYVLFHECICHAFQCIAPGETPREELGGGDRFSEGWIDWLAAKIFEREIHNDRACVLSSGHWSVGQELHLARGNKDCANRSKDAFFVYIGHSAANKVYFSIQRLERARGEGWKQRSWEQFLRLSLDLNVLCRALHDRYETAQRFDVYLSAETPYKHRTMELLAEFISDGDTEKLVNELHKLPYSERAGVAASAAPMATPKSGKSWFWQFSRRGA